MEVNDFVDDGADFENQPSSRPASRTINLTKSDFDYSMTLLDKKINSLYNLCRYVSDKQQENTKTLKRLVALDELSNNFWNVSSLSYLAFLF